MRRWSGWEDDARGDVPRAPGSYRREALLIECHDAFNRGRDVHLSGFDDEVGMLGRLVRIRDAGELARLPGDRFCVEAFGVARRAGRDVGLQVDLDEAFVSDDLSCALPVGFVRRDQRDDDRDALAVEQLRDFGRAAAVFCTVFTLEAEIRRYAGAQFVAVENADREAARAGVQRSPARAWICLSRSGR
ncbi:hypothetical protein WM32_06195 [Burkholderia ubonensis]|nr:hypothetical protein WM23_24635 [Burkholderia ubonensis]KWO89796.1 hypothetical protein WM32_06195 [Burkholderia ubonensis]